MKVQDIRKKITKCDTFSTITILNYGLRIIGLSCIYRDGTLKFYFPFWKITLLIVFFSILNAYSTYIKLRSGDGRISFTFAYAIEMSYLLGYIQYVFDIIFVYKYGRQSYIDYFHRYDIIDGIIRMPYYIQIRNSISKLFIFFCFTLFVSIFIDYFSWMSCLTWISISAYIAEYVYLGIRILSILDMISHWIQIKYRLETIGDIVENYYTHTNDLPGMSKDVIYDKVWNNLQNRKNSDRFDYQNVTLHSFNNLVLNLNSCYILLNEQCDFVNIKYGFRTLFSNIIFLLDMVLMINLVIRLLIGTLVLTSSFKYLPVLASLITICIYSLISFCEMYYCEQNYRQNERILRFIDLVVVNKKTSNEIHEALKELKHMIISRPISFHALNFYRLDYAALLSMASAIVTYTIILLQNMK